MSVRIQLPDPKAFQKVFYEIVGTKLDKPISGITINSTLVQEGDLFIALKGERVDGHQFISEVAKKGASALLVKYRDIQTDVTQIEVDDPLTTIGLIANQWRQQFNIPIIGITGSNGKTSTKELLRHIFHPEMSVHATTANYNTSISLPLTLLQLTDSHSISLIEMGASQPGDIAYLSKIAEPTHGLITNIAPAHLDGFKTTQNVALEKGELFRSLKSGISFMNKSDSYIPSLDITGKSISFGFTPNCDFSADIYKDDNDFISVIINSHEIHTKSQNLSFAKNVLSAAAVSIMLGVDWQLFQKKILSFTPPPGRCEIKQFENVTIIDDTYNANLESTLSAIDFLSNYQTNGNRYFIFGDMFELGEESLSAHQQVGKKCSHSNINGVFTVGILTKETDRYLSSELLHEHFTSKENCVLSLKKLVKSGDTLLFKGSRGMAMESIIKEIFK